MFGEGIFGVMCFHSAAVEFITFTFVGVAPSPRFIIKNTQTVAANFSDFSFSRGP